MVSILGDGSIMFELMGLRILDEALGMSKCEKQSFVETVTNCGTAELAFFEIFCLPFKPIF